MIIDGKKISEILIDEMKVSFAKYINAPTLAIITISDDPSVAQFVRIKKRIAALLGVQVRDIVMPADSIQDAVMQTISKLATDEAVHGIIVQLPLPTHMAVDEVLNAIPPQKDVDALTSCALVPAPVATAVLEILHYHNVPLHGAHTLVVGQGRLVGKPVAELLRNGGAIVSTLDRPVLNLAEYTKNADIIVLGAGSPGMLRSDMVRDGVVIIDAGTSEQGGKVVGDADPSCSEVASLITPVPGGVGPVAVAMIYKNLLELTAKTAVA